MSELVIFAALAVQTIIGGVLEAAGMGGLVRVRAAGAVGGPSGFIKPGEVGRPGRIGGPGTAMVGGAESQESA
jgi:hypothetical protein